MLHRADAVFALPELPATASVVGEQPGWEENLAERGVERASGTPDLAVAGPGELTEALRSGARSVIVDGGRRVARELRGAGWAVTRLLPVPVSGSPLLYLDADRRAATSYGLVHCISHEGLWRPWRNRAVAGLARAGALPAMSGVVTVASRAAGRPGVLAAAAELGAPPDGEWLMLVSPGSVVRRNAFLLFGPGAREPELVVKFSRVPGESWQFDREERGLSLALEAGGTVASHAPRQLGRTEVRGHHLSVETAGTGTKLTTLLRLPGSRRRKAAVLDSIAAWIVRVARETAAPPPALRPELDRLTREVLPLWADEGVDPGLAEALPPLPAAFQHNDVAEENVIVRGDGFTIIDWEWVRPRYLPVTDTVYFAARVLRLLDGALLEEERDPHFEALFSGQAPSSPILFRWLRELVRALEIPAEAVGPLVTLTWLDQATASDRERRKAEEASGREIPPDYMERSAVTWLRNPALGPGWSAWREAR